MAYKLPDFLLALLPDGHPDKEPTGLPVAHAASPKPLPGLPEAVYPEDARLPLSGQPGALPAHDQTGWALEPLPELPDGFFYGPPYGGLFKRGKSGRPDLRITSFPFALIGDFIDARGRRCADFALKLPHVPWRRFSMPVSRALAGGVGTFGNLSVNVFSTHGLRAYVSAALNRLDELSIRAGRAS